MSGTLTITKSLLETTTDLKVPNSGSTCSIKKLEIITEQPVLEANNLEEDNKSSGTTEEAK